MASLEKNILCLYLENPDRGESIISALAEIAEFAEHRTIIEVLTLLRRASEHCDHVEQQLSAPAPGPLNLDYYSE